MKFKKIVILFLIAVLLVSGFEVSNTGYVFAYSKSNNNIEISKNISGLNRENDNLQKNNLLGASNEDTEYLGKEIPNSEYGVWDYRLYTNLLEIYNTTYSKSYNKLYSKMFVEFTHLDLSWKNIQHISGLEYFEFTNLESIDLSKNNIKTIYEFETESLQNIKVLNLFNNSLTSVALNKFSDLTNLNLSRNNLKQVDISSISGGLVNIGFNQIERIENIVLPTITSELTLYTVNNNFSIPSSYYTNYSNIKFNHGLYGVGLNTRENPNENQTIEFTTAKEFLFYGFYDQNINLIVYKNSYINNNLQQTEYLKIDNIDYGNNTGFSLPVGEYSFVYVDENQLPIYNITNNFYGIFKGYDKISILPATPSFHFSVDGKTHNLNRQVITDNTYLVFEKLNPTDVVMYKIGNGDWQVGDTVLLPVKDYNYEVYAKVVVDGVESELQYITIVVPRKSIISYTLAVIILFVLIFAMVVGVTYYLYINNDKVSEYKRNSYKRKRRGLFRRKRKNKNESEDDAVIKTNNHNKNTSSGIIKNSDNNEDNN